MAARRRTAALAALLAGVLALPLVTGCSGGRDDTDCGSLARTIGEDADRLGQAMGDDSKDPQGAQEFVDRINRDLDKLSKQDGDDSSVKGATTEIAAAVSDIQDGIADGEHPAPGPLKNAVAALNKACAAG
ncbi:hypothetical protein [Streptomyces orinoci]|uniref:Secreted protein n=1 Tax=Streptomyces orinoci TaxID=67339 RepID=A0ABV3JUI7_STRON|nr:hypothetical protein [Streptomyces orinoci]